MAYALRKTETNEKKLNRAETTEILRKAIVSYYAHKNFSCYSELGVVPWGKRRLDVFAMSMKGQYVGVEIKSCLADYRADDKWHEYLEHVNKFYFCFSQRMYEKHKEELNSTCKAKGVGIFVLCERSGHLRVVLNAKRHTMDKDNKLRLLLKVAWRGGESRRTHRRRQRYFLN